MKSVSGVVAIGRDWSSVIPLMITRLVPQTHRLSPMRLRHRAGRPHLLLAAFRWCPDSADNQTQIGNGCWPLNTVANDPQRAFGPCRKQPASCALPECEDSMLAAWYRFPLPGSPRTGGAHARHYRTAGIDSCPRRRGGVAAGGARAAGRQGLSHWL